MHRRFSGTGTNLLLNGVVCVLLFHTEGVTQREGGGRSEGGDRGAFSRLRMSSIACMRCSRVIGEISQPVQYRRQFVDRLDYSCGFQHRSCALPVWQRWPFWQRRPERLRHVTRRRADGRKGRRAGGRDCTRRGSSGFLKCFLICHSRVCGPAKGHSINACCRTVSTCAEGGDEV